MPSKKNSAPPEVAPVTEEAAPEVTPESLVRSAAMPSGTTLEAVFNATGIPVLQHKFRKALMGSAGTIDVLQGSLS